MLKDQAMFDEAALQEIYGKLMSGLPGAIITLLIGLIAWIVQRQIKRLDGHDVKIDKCNTDISSLHETDQRLDMQLSQHKSDSKSDIIRLEADMEDREARIFQIIESSDRNTEKYMALMSEHFKTLLDHFKKE